MKVTSTKSISRQRVRILVTGIAAATLVSIVGGQTMGKAHMPSAVPNVPVLAHVTSTVDGPPWG